MLIKQLKFDFELKLETQVVFQQAYAYGDRAIDSLYISDGMAVSPISCPGGSNGVLKAEAAFGTGSGYTYVWNTGATSQTISGLTAGTYTVTITNTSSSTSKTVNKTLTAPTIPTPSSLAASPSAVCSNQNVPVNLSIDFAASETTYSVTSAVFW